MDLGLQSVPSVVSSGILVKDYVCSEGGIDKVIDNLIPTYWDVLKKYPLQICRGEAPKGAIPCINPRIMDNIYPSAPLSKSKNLLLQSRKGIKGLISGILVTTLSPIKTRSSHKKLEGDKDNSSLS